MRTWSVPIFLFWLSGCATFPTPTSKIKPELANDFLKTVCSSGEQTFSKSWLDHETKHWDFYKSLYYNDSQFLDERTTLANRYAQAKVQVCKFTRAFVEIAPSVIKVSTERVASLMNVRPRLPIYFAVALQETDGRGDVYKDEDILVLNARHDTFQRLTGLQVTVAHELVHDTQTTLQGNYKMPPVLRALYREGGAVFAIQQLYPEIGEGAWGLNANDQEKARKALAPASKALLETLDDMSAKPAMRRFFQGGISDPMFPPKMGYVVGSEIYHRISRKIGTQAAVRISPVLFAKEAKEILSDLASSRF